MKNTNLILPNEKYLYSYLDACQEFKDNNIFPNPLHDPNQFDTWKDSIFHELKQKREGINLPEGVVPSTIFWLVDDEGFIGRGSIRHYLNERLERFGGHIGYSIRKSKWNQGYGSLIMKLLMIEATNLDIKEALVTSSHNNTASSKIIEKNGGILIDTVENIYEGTVILTKRYHVRTGDNLPG